MKNRIPNMKKRTLLFLLFSLWAVRLNAQRQQADEARKLHPDASAIYLTKSSLYKIFIENNKLTGTCSIQEQLFINKESGIANQKESISSSGFVKAQNIKAATLLPKGNGYERKKVENIELKDSPDRNIFFDDDQVYNFIYPNVQQDAILDLSYEFRYEEPRFMGRYYWIDYLPSMQSEVVISVQNNINIQYRLFNCDEKSIEFSKEVTKKETIYRWKLKHIKTDRFYNDGPTFAYYTPNMVFYVTDYVINGEKKRLLGSPRELYNWYYDLQKNVNKTEDKNLKHLTDSLVQGITNEKEKVKKIFYWVQDNVSYLAIEDGLGGFVPRDAGLVCTRKFGDCKDMASIIHEMLRMAGVSSYLTWIGSRDIPFDYNQMPTPAVDNHMIASYRDPSGKWIFLDGTGKDASWDLTTSFIQGKEAMIGINPDSFLLVTIPIKDTSISQVIDSVYIEMKDQIVIGKGKIDITGYDRLDYLYHLENLSKEEREEYFKSYFAKGNNKTKFSDVTYTNENRNTPLRLTYSLVMTDYAKTNKNELYINLNMGSEWGLDVLKNEREVPLNLKHLTTKKLVTIFTIPPGYTVQYIPENKKTMNELIGYSNSYQVKGNQIHFTSVFYINTLLLYPKDFDKYNQVINDQIKANKQTVSLIKL